MTIRYTKSYRLKSYVKIYLVRTFYDDQAFLMLGGIEADDPQENKALAEEGELFCCDSCVEFEDGCIVCSGSDNYHGGTHNIVLYIPQVLIKSIEVENQ